MLIYFHFSKCKNLRKKDVFTTAPNISPTWHFKSKRISDLTENSLLDLKQNMKKENMH